jgi:S-adenosylmethionine:tRNA ribosyltransferase-isomerase
MTPTLSLSDFDFHLPEKLIAQTPAKERNDSRLMIVNRATQSIQEDYFSNLSKYLTSKDSLVFNNTKVIPAKLIGKKKGSEKTFETLLIRETPEGLWECLVKGLKKLNEGDVLFLTNGKIKATLEEKRNGRGLLHLQTSQNLQDILEKYGGMPLPPYIKRLPEDEYFDLDRERYQTVFAQETGAIAAPTAGLHFTNKQISDLNSQGIKTLFVTLHVGPGTFQPVREENILLHKMEKEQFIVQKQVWTQLLQSQKKKNNIVAIGTTATRVLESLDFKNNSSEELQTGWTNLFIYPGYQFQNVDKLLTNFHLPKSTLFMLTCAFTGKKLAKQAYQKAIDKSFRFFSYGDAMLII